MPEQYYHYSYQVQELGETIDAHVSYGSELDEEIITQFIREDVGDTYPDGVILSLELTSVTDAQGYRL